MDEKSAAVTGEGLEKVFAGAGDFVVREFKTPSGTQTAYFIDGLVSSSEISDFVLGPLVRGEQAWNAVAEAVDSLDAAAKKLNF